MAWQAGWYQQPDGSHRYWDGQRWTVTDAEYRAGQTGSDVPANPARTRLPAWGWIAIALSAVVMMCGGLGLLGSTLEPVDRVSGAEQPSATAEPTPSASTATPSTAQTTTAPPTTPAAPSTPEPAASASAVLPPPPVVPPPPRLDPPTPAAAGTVVAVTKVVDGDTIETSVGTIRLIGIDTPERGECNYATATAALTSALAAHGNQVVLVPGATDDRDKYDRLLRYVDSPTGDDLNLHMISTGLAKARYDSRDGYGRHPRETAYVAADSANAAPACALSEAPSTPAPVPPPAAAAPPVQEQPPPQAQPAPLAAVPAPAPGEPWNQPGPDLDCSDIGQRVTITGPDYHGLDGDGDGIGCESFG